MVILSMGACIGECLVVTKVRRTADVQCLTEVIALVFNFVDIEDISEKNERLKKLLLSLIEKRAQFSVSKLIHNAD